MRRRDDAAGRRQREEQKTSSLTLHDLLTIVVIASAFGLMGFLYSLIDLTQPPHKVVALEPFRALTVQEIGGHFLFGFIAGIASRNLRVAVLIGLMALTIDADHLLNVAKLPVQARLDHSIFFAILSSPLIGLLAVQIVQNGSRLLSFPPLLLPFLQQLTKRRNARHKIANRHYSKNYTDNASDDSISNQNFNKRKFSQKYIFLQFSIITVAAIISHISYDVFVDDDARFPLANPFSFLQIYLPWISALPLEVAGFIIIYLSFAYLRGKEDR